MLYPPFACYDPEVGYDRKRTEHAPSGDQLGWIEYCRGAPSRPSQPHPAHPTHDGACARADQDEAAKAPPGGDMVHLRPRLTDAERLPIEAYLTTPRDSLSAVQGESVTVHATSRVGALRLRVFREGASDGECVHEQQFEAEWQPIRHQAWWRGAGWPAGATLAIPADWPSGAYRLEFSAASATGVTPKLHSLVTGGSGSDEEFVYCALLVVRAAKPAATSKILFKLSSNSYYAVRKRESSVCLLDLRVPR